MVSQPAADDDPKIECALAIVDDQGGQDGPVVPAEDCPLQSSSPKTSADCDRDEEDEEHINAYENTAGSRGS